MVGGSSLARLAGRKEPSHGVSKKEISQLLPQVIGKHSLSWRATLISVPYRWTCASAQARHAVRIFLRILPAGYDYTFMCALHPDMRPDWAAAWARFLKPGGTLACLVFPVDSERQTGPPWPVTPEIYEDLLSKHGGLARSVSRVAER